MPEATDDTADMGQIAQRRNKKSKSGWRYRPVFGNRARTAKWNIFNLHNAITTITAATTSLDNNDQNHKQQKRHRKSCRSLKQQQQSIERKKHRQQREWKGHFESKPADLSTKQESKITKCPKQEIHGMAPVSTAIAQALDVFGPTCWNPWNIEGCTSASNFGVAPQTMYTPEQNLS